MYARAEFQSETIIWPVNQSARLFIVFVLASERAELVGGIIKPQL